MGKWLSQTETPSKIQTHHLRLIKTLDINILSFSHQLEVLMRPHGLHVEIVISMGQLLRDSYGTPHNDFYGLCPSTSHS